LKSGVDEQVFDGYWRCMAPTWAGWRCGREGTHVYQGASGCLSRIAYCLQHDELLHNPGKEFADNRVDLLKFLLSWRSPWFIAGEIRRHIDNLEEESQNEQ
jgi:hypothetical protein